MQHGAQNGIVGDDFGVTIPETQVAEDALIEEKKAAKYSRSHEYKKLKAHWEERIKYYQTFLPDGRPVVGLDKVDPNMWVVANTIIAELQNVMNYYEDASEIVGKTDV